MIGAVSPTVGSDLWRFLPSRTTIGNLEVGNVYKSLIVPVVESLVRRTENDSAIGFGKIREGGGGRGFNFCVRLYANRGVDDVDSMGEEDVSGGTGKRKRGRAEGNNNNNNKAITDLIRENNVFSVVHSRWGDKAARIISILRGAGQSMKRPNGR